MNNIVTVRALKWSFAKFIFSILIFFHAAVDFKFFKFWCESR